MSDTPARPETPPAATGAIGAVIAPGYGGTAEQPIVRAMAARLAALGWPIRALSYTRPRAGPDLTREVDDVRRARQELLDQTGLKRIALVGRSFGGRVCARLAAADAAGPETAEQPAAVVVLGHPISPRGRPRPEDEAALAAVRCPMLIVQGDHDALGPLAVLQRLGATNPRMEIHVLRNTGHQFGAQTAPALDYAVKWLTLHA